MSSDEESEHSSVEAEENNENESVSDEEEPQGEALDSDNDYDDEDEEEDNARYKKRRQERHGGFILDEAEVDDEVESEDEWEDGAQEVGIVANEIDELGPTAQEIEGRIRGNNFWTSQKEDEIEEYLRRKYAGESASAKHFGDGGEDMSDEITQQTRLPGVKDPNLWMVKCRIGEEKNTALLLMRKYIAYQLTDEPLQIKSVLAPEGVKGYIYIEAYKQTHVKQAIDKVGSLRLGIWKQQMVPIKEMTDVLRVTKEHSALKPRQWVRLKRGLYKDDIAQIDYVDVAQNEVHLKILPRIDYSKPRGALRLAQENEILKRKKKRRPVAKPFDPEAIRAIGGDVTSDGDFLIFEGNRYSLKGFLYKNFNMNAIIMDGVKPTLSELEKFEESPEGVDIELPSSDKDEIADHVFNTGDNVEVCQGELMHLQGKILSIDGNFITVMPKHDDLKTPLEFQATELKKFFKMGDHVRVIAGRYEGDTGLIIRAEENRIVLFSDLTMHELEILPRDLQLCTETATGVDSLGQYQYGDMIQIDPQTVGVIVRLEREIFHVLNMHGKVVEVKPQMISKRKENNNFGLDSDQQTIQKHDVVKVIDGPHSGRSGEIKHLFRNYVFLYSKLYLDNGGIFVCKTRHILLAGGARDASRTIILDSGFMSPRISSPAHPSGGGGNRGRGRGGFNRRDMDIIGKTIKITRGPYKGSVGIVKDSTDTTSRVELHTSCQTISVDRSHINIASELSKDGSYSTYGRTPACVGQTPTYAGSRTPMLGSQTPLYDSGHRTPHYYGSMTPMQDGSRTPAPWEGSGSNTPARQSEFGEENWDSNDNGSIGYAPDKLNTGGSTPSMECTPKSFEENWNASISGGPTINYAPQSSTFSSNTSFTSGTTVEGSRSASVSSQSGNHAYSRNYSSFGAGFTSKTPNGQNWDADLNSPSTNYAPQNSRNFAASRGNYSSSTNIEESWDANLSSPSASYAPQKSRNFSAPRTNYSSANTVKSWDSNRSIDGFPKLRNHTAPKTNYSSNTNIEESWDADLNSPPPADDTHSTNPNTPGTNTEKSWDTDLNSPRGSNILQKPSSSFPKTNTSYTPVIPAEESWDTELVDDPVVNSTPQEPTGSFTDSSYASNTEKNWGAEQNSDSVADPVLQKSAKNFIIPKTNRSNVNFGNGGNVGSNNSYDERGPRKSGRGFTIPKTNRAPRTNVEGLNSPVVDRASQGAARNFNARSTDYTSQKNPDEDWDSEMID